MKKNYILGLLATGLLISSSVFAQKDNVGIGTTKPDQSAVLDINSTNKGLLIPRMTLQQRNGIQNPATGLMVYQSDLLSGFYFYDGSEWKPLTAATSQNSVAGTDGDWTLVGNSLAGTSTTPTTTPGTSSFLGTTTNHPIVLKVNNINSGFLSAISTNFALGYRANSGVYSGTTTHTGNFNTALGTDALRLNTGGSNNVALGYRTLEDNLTGSGNVAIGSQALTDNTGALNVGIGSQALHKNTLGANNVALGASTLSSNLSGSNNIAIGFGSLVRATSGNNVALGANALAFVVANGNNIGIGYQAGLNATGGSNIFIGNQAGMNDVTGSNKLYVANTNTATPLIGGDFGATAAQNNRLRFHMGTGAPTNTTGYLAIGDFSTATPLVLKFGNGATANTSYRLVVQDGILTEKLKVALKGTADWADYVFEPDYQLMPLENVESFVKENKHLPNVPSAEELSKEGLDMQKTSAKLMEKIEELTLYMIEMNKEMKALKAENAKLKEKLK